MPDFLNRFEFNYRLLKRVIMVAPRKSQQIKKLYIDYTISPINNLGKIVIRYRFRNALWYIVDGKKTLDTTYTLPENTKEISFAVYGIKEVCTYSLLFKEDYIDILKSTREKR